ncbi:hypothetical protein FNF28_05732 [Cafeteria roenbergensis]|uniref:Piezo non-specific cation channel R-Ras-binding domain-containing protein n=1 Tax=Cafeteria roenbergensis TaxID=33653 RepID=A0A5A8D3B8_CAFRO|nr:hypothetical protein FNF28_05732 [Cafeteria roenbergensis]
MGLSALTAALALACTAVLVQSAVSLPLLVILVVRVTRWACSSAAWWGRPTLLGSRLLAIVIAVYCGLAAVAWHGSSAILTMLRPEALAPVEPPAWFFELEKLSAAVGLLRLPAGGGTSWYTAHFVSLIVATAAFAALFQRKVAVSRAQAARRAEEEEGEFAAAGDGTSGGASRGASAGSLAGAPPKAASDEAVAVGAFGAAGLSAAARREELRSGPMLPDEEGHVCATVCGCVCTPCPANRPGPSCASRVLASLVSLMRGQLGMTLVLAAILAWITTFPDAVSLAYAVAVVGVFVLARGSNGTTAASPLIASSVRAFAAVHSLYLLGFHASCAVAPFFAPAPFIAASRSDDADVPLNTQAVFHLYNGLALLLGIVPGQYTPLRMAFGLGVLVFAAVYSKAASVPPDAALVEAEVALAHSVAGTVEAALSDVVGQYAWERGPHLDDETTRLAHWHLALPPSEGSGGRRDGLVVSRAPGTGGALVGGGSLSLDQVGTFALEKNDWRGMSSGQTVRLPCVMAFAVQARWGAWALLQWLRSQSHWLALVAMYVLGLSHVDVVAAGYLVFFVLFFVSKRARSCGWRLLVAYSGVSVCVVVGWWVMALHDRATALAIPGWAFGLSPPPHSPPMSGSSAPSLWFSVTVPTNVLIFLLVSSQLSADFVEDGLCGCTCGGCACRRRAAEPRTRRQTSEDAIAAARNAAEVRRRFPWAEQAAAWLVGVWLRNGVWLCFGLYLVLPLLRPTVMGLVTLVVLSVVLGFYLVSMQRDIAASVAALELRGSGTDAKSLGRGAAAAAQATQGISATRLRVPLGAMSAIQAVFLLLRYVYQFGSAQRWIDQLWNSTWLADWFTVHQLGLERYTDDSGNALNGTSLYLSLLDTPQGHSPPKAPEHASSGCCVLRYGRSFVGTEHTVVADFVPPRAPGANPELNVRADFVVHRHGLASAPRQRRRTVVPGAGQTPRHSCAFDLCALVESTLFHHGGKFTVASLGVAAAVQASLPGLVLLVTGLVLVLVLGGRQNASVADGTHHGLCDSLCGTTMAARRRGAASEAAEAGGDYVEAEDADHDDEDGVGGTPARAASSRKPRNCCCNAVLCVLRNTFCCCCICLGVTEDAAAAPLRGGMETESSTDSDDAVEPPPWGTGHPLGLAGGLNSDRDVTAQGDPAAGFGSQQRQAALDQAVHAERRASALAFLRPGGAVQDHRWRGAGALDDGVQLAEAEASNRLAARSLGVLGRIGRAAPSDAPLSHAGPQGGFFSSARAAVTGGRGSRAGNYAAVPSSSSSSSEKASSGSSRAESAAGAPRVAAPAADAEAAAEQSRIASVPLPLPSMCGMEPDLPYRPIAVDNAWGAAQASIRTSDVLVALGPTGLGALESAGSSLGGGSSRGLTAAASVTALRNAQQTRTAASINWEARVTEHRTASLADLLPSAPLSVLSVFRAGFTHTAARLAVHRLRRVRAAMRRRPKGSTPMPEQFYGTSVRARELPRRPFRDAWLIVLPIAGLLLLAKYASQFKFAASLDASLTGLDGRWAGFWVVNTANNATMPLSGRPDWAPLGVPSSIPGSGVAPSGFVYSTIFAGMWALVGPEVFVIVMAVLQRWAHTLDSQDTLRERRRLGKLHSTGVLEAIAADAGSLDARVPLDQATVRALGVMQAVGLRVMLMAGLRRAPSDGAMAEVSPVAVAGEQPGATASGASAAGATAAAAPAGRALSDADAAAAWPGSRGSSRPPPVRTRLGLDAAAAPAPDRRPRLASGGAGVEPADLLPLQWEVHRAVPVGVLLDGPAADAAARHALFLAGGGYTSMLDSGKLHVWDGDGAGGHITLTRGSALQSGSVATVAALAFGGAALEAAHAAVRYAEAGTPFRLAVYAAACDLAVRHGLEPPEPPAMAWVSPEQVAAVRLCLAVEAPGAPRSVALKLARLRLRSRQGSATSLGSDGGSEELGFLRQTMEERGSPSRSRVVSAGAEAPAAGHGVADGARVAVSSLRRSASAASTDSPARAAASAAGGAAAPTPPIGERRPRAPTRVEERANLVALESRSRFETAAARLRVVRERLLRPLVPASAACGRSLERHRGRTLLAISAVLLVAASLCLLSFWSLPLVFYAAVAIWTAVMRPTAADALADASPALRDAALVEADSPGGVAALLIAAQANNGCRGPALLLVRWLLALQILAQYVLILGVPPALWSQQGSDGRALPLTIWPWSADQAARAWLGMPEQGRDAVWLLTLQMLAFLGIALAVRYDRSRQRAAVLLLAGRHFVNVLQSDVDKASAASALGGHPAAPRHRASSKADARPKTEEELHAAQDKLAKLSASIAAAVVRSHRLKAKARLWRVRRYASVVSEAMDMAERGSDMAIPLQTAAAPFGGRRAAMGDKEAATSRRAAAGNEVMNELEGARVFGSNIDGFVAVVATYSGSVIAAILLTIAMLDGSQDIQTFFLVALLLYVLFRRERQPGSGQNQAAVADSQVMGKHAQMSLSNLIAGLPSLGQVLSLPGSDKGAKSGAESVASGASPGAAASVRSAEEVSARGDAASDQGRCLGWHTSSDRAAISARIPWIVMLVASGTFLLMQLVYQIPSVDGIPACAAQATCLTAEGLIGLRKLSLPGFAVDEASPCFSPMPDDSPAVAPLSNSTQEPSNVNCPSPFQMSGGGLGLLLLMVIGSLWQLLLLDSSVTNAVRAAHAEDAVRARLRGWVWFQHERHRRQKQTRAFKTQLRTRRRRLRALVRRVARWRALLDGAKTAASTVAAASNAFPPAAPRLIRAAVLPTGDVEVSWDPPVGYTNETPRGQQSALARSSSTGQADEMDSDEDSNGRRSSVRRSHEGVAGAGSVSSSTFLAGSGTMMAIGALQPAADLTYDVSWQARGSQLFPATITPRTAAGQHSVVLRGLPIGRHVTLTVRACNPAGAGPFADKGAEVGRRTWVAVLGSGPVELAKAARVSAGNRGLDVEAAAWRAGAAPLLGAQTVAAILASQALREAAGAKADADAASQTLTSPQADAPGPAATVPSPPARGPPQPLAAASAGRPSLAPPPQHQHHSSGSGASSAGSPPAGGIVLHDRQAGSVPAAVAAQAAQAPVQGAEVGGVPIVLTGGATLTPKEQADLRLRAAAAAKTARGEDDQGCVAATRTWFAGLCAPGPEKDAAELLRGADDTAFGWFVNKLAGAVDRTVKPRPVAGFVSSLVTLEDAFVAVGLRCRGAASGGDGNDDDDDDSGRSGRDRQGCCACCAKPGPKDASAGPQTGESIVESASKVDGQDAATVMSASVRGAGQAGDARSEAGGKPAPAKRAAASRGAADEDEDEDEDDTGGDGKPSKGEAAAAAGMEDVDEAAAEVEEENTGRVSHTLRSLLRERAELAVSDAKAGAVTAGEAWALLPWWARVGLLAHLSMFAVLSHTHVLVAAVAVLSLLVDASVVAALPTVVLLVLILPRYPMAPAASWWALTIWLVVLVVVKNLLQTPLFCLLVHPETRNLFWAAGAECISPSPITPATSSSLAPGTVLYPASSPQAIVAAAQLVQPVQAFGITKFSPLLGGEGFGPGIAWDCILLLTLLVHRAALVAKGTWATDGVVGISAVRSAAAAEAAILPAPKATKDRDAMAFGQESDEEEDKADPEGEDDEQAPEAVVVAAAAFSRKRRSSAGSGRMAAAASAVSAAHAAAAAAPGRPRGASALRRTALDAIAEGQEGPSAALSAARGDVDPAADGVDVDELAGHHGGNGDSPHSGGHSPSGDKHDSDDDDDGLIQGLADVAAHSGNLGHSRSRSSPDHDEGALLAAIVGIAPAASAPGQAAGGAPLSEGGAAQAPVPPPPALSGAAAAGAQRRHSRGESDPDDTDTYDEDVDEAGSDGLGAGAADSGPASAAQPAWATVMEAVLPFEAAPSPAPLGRSRRRSGSDVAGAALTPEERLDAEAEACAGKGLPTALQSDFAVVRWAAFTVAREEILPKWRRRLEGELAIAAAGSPSPAGDAADRASLARQQLHRDGPDPRQAAEPQDSGAGVASSGQPYRRHTSGARVPFQREGIAGLPPHTESAPSQLRDAPPDASADGKAAALEQVVVHTGAATEGAPAPAPAGKTDSGTPLSGGRPSPRANVAVAAATAVVMAPVRASDRLLSCARMCAAKSVLCAFDTLSGITNRQYQGLSRRMPDKPGVDLFWGTAIAQLVLLLYTLVTFGAMTGNGAGLQEELAYNQFSGSLVVALVLQIFLMAVDRVAFLWRSATLKAVLQAVTSIGVHISVFYVIPLQTQRALRRREQAAGRNDMNYRKADKETLSGKQQQPFWAAKFIYGWCMVIVILVCIVGPMLLFSNLNPTLESNLITNVATTVRLMGENRSYAVYASTQTESIELASTIGGNDKWFLQLQSNASGAEDAPVGAGALLAVRSPVETDWLDQTQRSVVFPFPDRRWTVAPPALDSLVDLLGRAAGSELRAFERRLAPSRGLAAPAQSSSEAAPQAQPAPRATTGFASRLFPEAALRPYAAEYSPGPAPDGLEGQFERPGPTGAEVARWESAVPISQEQALVLHDALVAAANSSFAARTTTAVGAPIVVRGVFPYVLRLPATTAVAAIGQRTRDIRLQLHIGIPADPLEAQAMRRRAEAEAEAFAASRGFGARGDGLAARATSTMQTTSLAPRPRAAGSSFITVSDRIAPNLLTSSLGGSIIAVYTLLLITVAGLFRGTCVVKSQQVMYQELEDCRYLMELCEAIHFAEADTQYPRHLENEVYLYETLIGFYRSPEILARITRKRD